MGSPFVAEVRMFGFTFAPTGWAQCNGQIMPISQNTALFSLIGNLYGGDGKATFALPNLQGSVAVGSGQGSGLKNYTVGQSGGSANVTLLATQLPTHTHTLFASSAAGTSTAPAKLASADIYTNTNTNTVATSFSSLAFAGGDFPHNNMMPTLTVQFCIALMGVFPPRP